MKVGGEKVLKTEARIIAATNHDLKALIARGQFREDLFYRLKVVEIFLPPLRERKEDIPDLVAYLLEKINRELRRNVRKVPPEVMALLQEMPWRGNVRELENTLLRAAVLCQGRLITPADLALTRQLGARAPAAVLPLEDAVRDRVQQLFSGSSEPPRDLYDLILAAVERPLLEVVLERVGGNQVRAAELLGINRNTLRKKITDLGIVLRRTAVPVQA